MNGLKILSAAIILTLISSCQNVPKSLSPRKRPDSAVSTINAGSTNIRSLFNEAESIDSLVILYFTDKIKFRYYTFYTTSQSQHLSLLKENLLADTIRNKGCLKDGTIYGYIKGRIYTTLYFNLSDSCRSLRLIKHGTLYNFPLNASLQSELASLRKKSKSP